jgi:KDO2-lipid IV(A) lauroyltransferase
MALAEIAYFFLWTLGALIAAIPFGMKCGLGSTLAWLLFRVLGLRSQVVLHNLVRAFPREAGEDMRSWRERLEAIAFGHYRHLVLVFLEILERFHWSKAVFQKRVEVEGVEHVRKLQSEGRGFFFLTAHIGNWELISLAGVLLDIRLAIITRYMRNLFVDALWKRSRLRYGVELLEESGSGLGILRSIRAGKAVGFILDQYTGPPHGLEAEFFGVRTWCPKGLAILAPRLGAPVLPAYMVRLPDGRFRLTMGAPLDLPGDDLEAHVRVCNADIETWARRYPEQYLWVHKRFKGALDYKSPLPWA